MAQASGLVRLSPGERNARRTSSFGTGELIRAAVLDGVRTLSVGLGGSATNDGGAGLLQALGVKLKDVRAGTFRRAEPRCGTWPAWSSRGRCGR